MNMTADSMDSVKKDEQAGRLPNLAARTPGLDTEREVRTLQGAKAYDEGSDERGSRHILVPLDGSRLAAAAVPYA
ncbi:MAG: hypothetical protein M3Z19_06655, partial [Chloroflexota bacterium]|nr:hypothetical protein [Chloroflexota bacterium]